MAYGTTFSMGRRESTKDWISTAITTSSFQLPDIVLLSAKMMSTKAEFIFSPVVEQVDGIQIGGISRMGEPRLPAND
jgi:hypothetical protein